MKALTLWQPWATLAVTGNKKYETRSWEVKYRGPVMIHAGRKIHVTTRQMLVLNPFRDLLVKAGHKPLELPISAIVGTVEIVDCHPVDKLKYNGAISELELMLGDYRPGRWAWELANPKELKVPFKFSGKLGLFNVPDDLLSQFHCGKPMTKQPGLMDDFEVNLWLCESCGALKNG